MDATFLPQGGIDAITQQGQRRLYRRPEPDKRMQAWANAARYTPADQMLVLDRQSARCERRDGDNG